MRLSAWSSAAFEHFADIFNRTDPAGLPASDYAEPRSEANANWFTSDVSGDNLAKLKERFFGVGPYASMLPMCAPPK